MVKLRSDTFEALVSLDQINQHPDSFLATMVQLEVERCGLAGLEQIPTVRRECDPAVTKEVVEVLRQGSRYEPPRAPQHDPRLLKNLLHELAFLGLPHQQFACSSPHELMLPCYSACCTGIGDEGMFIYSAHCRGWARVHGADDPRPPATPCKDRDWRRSSTVLAGSSEDVAYLMPNGLDKAPRQKSEAFMLRFTQGVTLPITTQARGLPGQALAAASGKLFVLGGEHRRLKAAVADAYTGVWFSAPSPLPLNATLDGLAMLSNKAEGMLLVLGGRAELHQGPSAAPADVWDTGMVAKYDIRAGSWNKHPSGCAPPPAPGLTSLAAVAADEHTIMTLRAALPEVDEDGVRELPGRVDLLDLRMWRWREGAALQRDHLHGAALVIYDGQLLALGGCRAACQGADADEEVNIYALSATDVVSCYVLRSNAWSELPARLPVKLGYATPVVVRTRCVTL
ncbi:hypothetical protein COO60DRAFT_1654544 [Scenedesmus sp. NREL 46B-D3]|nr:hypothetical protein COO60DRAFT_1654544 [Scenedesmus sp. NREL 46B-D3]